MTPMRIPFPPAILITVLLAALMLYAAFLIAPATIQMALLVMLAMLVVIVAFTSIELALYLLILSTLLSPELTFGAASTAELEAGRVTTTESRGITIRVDDIMLTLICLTWMFRAAIYNELGLFRTTPLNRPIAVYMGIVAISTLLGFMADRVGAFGLFFVLKYLEYFILFFMLANYIQDVDSIRRYLTVMLFTCLVVSLIGIAQIPGGERVSAPFEGEVGEPNTFGGYLVLMFSVAFGLFLSLKSWLQRLPMLLLSGMIALPLAFTQSRSSYLAMAVALLAFMWLAEQRRTVMLLCLLGLVFAPVVLPRQVIERVTFTFAQPVEVGQVKVGGLHIDTSTSARLRSWQRTLTQDFIRHPFLGYGVTGGPFLDAQYPRVLGEAGLIGFVAFLWLLRRIWGLLRRAYAELADPRLKGVALGTLCGFAGLLFHAIGSNTFIIVRIMEPLMILVGLVVAAMLLQESSSLRLQTAAGAGE